MKIWLEEIRSQVNLIKALGMRMVDFDALAKKVNEEKDDQLTSLKELNEALHALAIRKNGREKEYKEFMFRCRWEREKKDRPDDSENFAIYARNYVPLHLFEQ